MLEGQMDLTLKREVFNFMGVKVKL